MDKKAIKTILGKAVEMFGKSSQERMAIEEMAELTDALMKKYRGRCTDEDIITEIADVTIMMKQLAIIYGEDAVRKEIVRKVTRLQERMLSHKYVSEPVEKDPRVLLVLREEIAKLDREVFELRHSEEQDRIIAEGIKNREVRISELHRIIDIYENS